MPFNANCDDGSELTNNDVCDDKGVCSGKCLVDEACNDRNKCTEDTCSMETGRCLFAPIVGCVSVLPPPTPTDCSVDKSFRFDFLAKPKADNAVEVCFFQVTFTPINGTAVVRTFGANDTQQRAVSFGIGDNSADAKIRANTALVMRFPMSWTASLQSIRVSSVGTDTVLAIVSGTPESNRESIAIALQAFDQDPKQTLTSGVWIMANDAGEHLSPPAIATLQAASWSVVHLRGQPFSLDGVTLSRPIDNNRAEWQAVEGGNTSTTLVDVASGSQATNMTTMGAVDDTTSGLTSDATLIGAIVGGVIGGLLLLGGMFFLGVWFSRRRYQNDENAKARNSSQSQTELHDLPPPSTISPPSSNRQYQSAQLPATAYQEMAMQPQPRNGYQSFGGLQAEDGYQDLQLTTENVNSRASVVPSGYQPISETIFLK
jgi:hypothetical protein